MQVKGELCKVDGSPVGPMLQRSGRVCNAEEKDTGCHKPVCDCAEVDTIYLRPDKSLFSGQAMTWMPGSVNFVLPASTHPGKSRKQLLFYAFYRVDIWSLSAKLGFNDLNVPVYGAFLWYLHNSSTA